MVNEQKLQVAVFPLGGTISSARPDPYRVPGASNDLRPTFDITHLTINWLISRFGGETDSHRHHLYAELLWEKNRIHDEAWQVRAWELNVQLTRQLFRLHGLEPPEPSQIPGEVVYHHGKPRTAEQLLERFTGDLNMVQQTEWTTQQYLDSLLFNPLQNVAEVFQLDSIDFTVEEHYEQLITDIKAALDRGEQPLLIWGTDTEQFYATMIARDLERDGYLQEGSGQKVVFLTSIYSPEEGLQNRVQSDLWVDRDGNPIGESTDAIKCPEHVAHLFDAAAAVLGDEQLTGAFALNAVDELANDVEVREVRNHFVKIYSASVDESEVNAFVSASMAGRVINGKFVRSPDYEAKYTPFPEEHEGKGVGNVMPPLLAGNSTQVILQYMEAARLSEQLPINAIIIEGIPGYPDKITEPGDLDRILNLATQCEAEGIAVVFNNPVIYDRSSGKMKPSIGSQWYDNQFMSRIREAGFEVWEKVPSMAFADAALMFAGDRGVDKKPAGDLIKIKPVSGVGIRYVPSSTFGLAVVTAGSILQSSENGKTLVVSSLSGNGMPGRYEGEFQFVEGQGVKIALSFDYNRGEAREIRNIYEAASLNLHRSAGDVTAAQLLGQILRGRQKG